MDYNIILEANILSKTTDIIRPTYSLNTRHSGFDIRSTATRSLKVTYIIATNSLQPIKYAVPIFFYRLSYIREHHNNIIYIAEEAYSGPILKIKFV